MLLLDILKEASESTGETGGEEASSITTADIVILAVVAAIVLALIIYFVYKKSKGKAILNDCDCGPSGSDLVKQYNKKYKKDVKPVDVKPTPVVKEETKPQTRSEVKEEPVQQVKEKTVEEKLPEKEEVETKKPVESKQKEEKVEKPAKAQTAKTSKSATISKEEKPEEKTPAKQEKKTGTKVYHLSKRASDNKWQVFIKGSEKVIKLFDTKAEAEEYCEKMAQNQGATLAVHNSKGENKGKISKSKVKAGK